MSETDVLDEPLRRWLGDNSARALASALDITTVGELLRHYPRRYFERGELTELAALRAGEQVTVQVEVTAVSSRKLRPKLHKTDIVVTDGRDRVTVTFFNRPSLAHRLRPGMSVLLSGEVEVFNRKRRFTNPELELEEDVDEFAGGLRSVYPATKKVHTWAIDKAVRTVLAGIDEVEDPLPADVRARERLVDLRTALTKVHRPADRREVAVARRRLAYDEAFVLQVTLAQRRAAARAAPAVPRQPRTGGLLDAFDAALPFALTAGQRAVAAEVAADLAEPAPMHRLLQGEVGSGKTVVALRAMLTVVDTGGQAALLAPTEVLAQQHERSMRALLGPLAQAGELGGADIATRVALLTGSLGAAARRTALDEVASGAAGIVVGTHALLEEDVRFADLGLVVIDEQHRFGVHQRDALRGKGAKPPHVLVMTATPIPRTVAMTVFGDLETSVLTELPAGRTPISTFVVPADNPAWVNRMWGRVRDEVAAGHQAYVVCPRIGDEAGAEAGGEDLLDAPDDAPDGGADAATVRRPAAAVVDVLPQLVAGELAGLRVAALHGRLPTEEKDATMRRFNRGEIDVLVATTVIEVGVDVPNATVMVILDADRFGISQLHQLRGRVGRGTAPGWCLLQSGSDAEAARERLDAVAATTDGFELARLDLEQRREGDVLGATQSGRRSSLRLLQLARDEDVIKRAREEASRLVAADPQLREHPALARQVAEMVDPQRAEYLDKA